MLLLSVKICWQVNDLLLPFVGDADASMETTALAALALGLVHVASAQEDAVEAILQVSNPMHPDAGSLVNPLNTDPSAGLKTHGRHIMLGLEAAAHAPAPIPEPCVSHAWVHQLFCIVKRYPLGCKYSICSTFWRGGNVSCCAVTIKIC